MKKWLVLVREDQYDWIKKTAAQTGLKGSSVIREVIDRTRTKEQKEVISSLMQAQVRARLEELEEAKEAIEKKISEVKNSAVKA